MSSWHHVIVSSFYHLSFLSSCQVTNFWQLLTTFANSWKLLAIFENWLQYLTFFCQFFLPVGNIWQSFSYLLATFSKFWQRLPSFREFAIFDSFWQNLQTSVILLSCHPVILSSWHILISSSCHSVLLSSCQSGSLSIVSLWAFQLAHLGACELVLHIRSMISFGGFLAECLPC